MPLPLLMRGEGRRGVSSLRPSTPAKQIDNQRKTKKPPIPFFTTHMLNCEAWRRHIVSGEERKMERGNHREEGGKKDSDRGNMNEKGLHCEV